jgi:hypothetical protein
MHQKRIRREQERLRKLEEMDRQRRENFVEIRRKTRDRIQIKRDLERERLRKKKCDDERKVGLTTTDAHDRMGDCSYRLNFDQEERNPTPQLERAS